MSTDPRWTEQTRDLAGRAWHDVECGPNCPDTCSSGVRYRHQADAVLTALAEAGLLLPPGGETREDFAIQHPGHSPILGRTERITDGMLAEALRHTPGTRKLRRTVHTGPWREVAEDGRG